MAWSENNIPDQTGRVAFVTGATSGLGLRIAQVLASKGARLLIASRNPERGERALATVAAAASGALPEIVEVDLADLGSVRAAAESVRERTSDHLDLLVNNAGIMAPPLGFAPGGTELQWATNVLGPALLTWSLLPALEHVVGSRVGFMSSIMHFGGHFSQERLEKDVRGEGYTPFGVYGRTKLADLLLSRELERHFLRVDAQTISVAAHPGWTASNLIDSTVSNRPHAVQGAAKAVTSTLAQSVNSGALPMLFALTEVGIRGSQYFGPAWVFETRGPPARAARSEASRSDELGARLLDFVEDRIGMAAPR